MTRQALKFSTFAIALAAVLASVGSVFAMGPAGGVGGMGGVGAMGGMGMSGGMGSGPNFMGTGGMTSANPDSRFAIGGNPSGVSVAPGQLGLDGMPSAPTGLPALPSLPSSTNHIDASDRAQ